MNCKQGDLARVVNSFAGKNDDKIVLCVHYAGLRLFYTDISLTKVEMVPAWKIDRNINNRAGFPTDLVPDNNLRPIRDNDGTDETLTWAGLPAKPEVTA